MADPFPSRAAEVPPPGGTPRERGRRGEAPPDAGPSGAVRWTGFRPPGGGARGPADGRSEAAAPGAPAEGPPAGVGEERPVVAEEPPAPDGARRRGQGRNLPAAIGVGLALGVVVVGSLFVRREAFVVLTALACIVAIWEVANAFRARRVRIPLVPTVVGAVGMLASAYLAGADALFVSLALTATAIVWWRVFEGPDPVRDVTAGVFTAVYVPYLAGFAVLMLADQDGPFRVMAFVIVAVASDVGGYLVGSLWGRHVLAPTVSPRKSWEGVAGSAVLASAAGAVSVALLLDGPWWWGVVLGLAVTVAATVGDLSESLLKRDLGIKDMGSLLPGHGGVMDRLDSLLPAAPVAYVVLTVLAG
ncbi:MAG: phosphatidate cytidylyltransferase [Kineosporiaceae bacterium]